MYKYFSKLHSMQNNVFCLKQGLRGRSSTWEGGARPAGVWIQRISRATPPWALHTTQHLVSVLLEVFF